MKFLYVIFLFLASVTWCQAQKIIFLHHSTGGGVYYEGNVAEWFQTYNSQNKTTYEISERNYPDTPYPWENYPYDYWNLWINGACNNSNTSIECMDKLAQKYQVIIFKHCFPGADIEPDQGNASSNSDRKSLENYKLQYRALRSLMDSYPNNKFIAWTLAPLHRNATSSANASRAKQFVDWVKNEWLTEDHQAHTNISVFDFFGLAAELSTSPSSGKTNCLKYAYEGEHNGSDSHPNTSANQKIGPLFGQFVVDAITKTNTSFNEINTEDIDICIYPNPTNNKITIDCGDSFRILNGCTIKIMNSLSQTIVESTINTQHNSIEINCTNGKGVYFIHFIDLNNNTLNVKKVILQ
jgi:hypothetical protein